MQHKGSAELSVATLEISVIKSKPDTCTGAFVCVGGAAEVLGAQVLLGVVWVDSMGGVLYGSCATLLSNHHARTPLDKKYLLN